MVKRGETIQYLIESTSGIGTMRVEYTENHCVFKPAQITTGNADFVGTVSTPITSELGWIKNESGKDQVFRYRAVTIGATSAAWSCTLTLQPHIARIIHDTIVILVDNDAPINGTDGDGASIAGAGSTYIDTSTGRLYRNDGNSAMPIWVAM